MKLDKPETFLIFLMICICIFIFMLLCAYLINKPKESGKLKEKMYELKLKLEIKELEEKLKQYDK